MRELWELYVASRTTTLVIYEKPVGRDGEKKVIPVVWPNGIATWPEEGGLYDQPLLEYRVFSAFLRGEIAGTKRLMAKVR